MSLYYYVEISIVLINKLYKSGYKSYIDKYYIEYGVIVYCYVYNVPI